MFRVECLGLRVQLPATSYPQPAPPQPATSQKNDYFLWIFQNKYYLCTRKTETTFCLPQTGIAQLVEHRSPKPGVGSSSLSSRAGLKSCKCLTCRTFLICYSDVIPSEQSLDLIFYASTKNILRSACSEMGTTNK